MRNRPLKMLIGASILAVSGGGVAHGDEPPKPVVATQERPTNSTTLQRLQDNRGLTLQWISWDYRGNVDVRTHGGSLYLTGLQVEKNGMGSVFLDGKIVESGDDYFIFSGLIRISGAPDADRVCEMNNEWRFAITQNRKYYRLREFEWCDGLTDYVDIYF